MENTAHLSVDFTSKNSLLAIKVLLTAVVFSAVGLRYYVVINTPTTSYRAGTIIDITPTPTPHVTTPTPTASPSPKPSTITNIKKTPPPKNKATVQLEAWIYPGPPSCNAMNELKTRDINTVKAEYLTLNDNGQLTVLESKSAGCNGFSSTNIALLKSYTKQQFVTISGSAEGMSALVNDTSLTNAFLQKTISFVTSNNLTGVDIDFEQYSSWSKPDYEKFKILIRNLGNSLHAKGKLLQIEFPPIHNNTTQSYYALRYEDFNSLPVDQYTIMAYDYQFDYGAGSPIQPLSWLKSVISWSKAKFKDKSKISIGLPSYGYKGRCTDSNISVLTYAQIKDMPGFSTAKRDPSSQEMMWKNGGYCYSYSDSTSLNKKLDVIKDAGITQVSLWHLGGNPWFN